MLTSLNSVTHRDLPRPITVIVELCIHLHIKYHSVNALHIIARLFGIRSLIHQAHQIQHSFVPILLAGDETCGARSRHRRLVQASLLFSHMVHHSAILHVRHIPE